MTGAETNSSSVLVGISTYNRAADLRKAIASAMRQSFRPIRVAVIDDASTDDTPAVQREFPAVSWQRQDPGQGYLQARNRMMLTASETYYVSLDDDAWFLRDDEISLAVDYLDKHPKVGAVAYDILSPDRPAAEPRGPAVPAAIFIGCGHVLRLSTVRALGGYTRFPGTYGAEEKDLSLRILDSGYELIKLPGVHVWHDKSSMERDAGQQYCSVVCNDFSIVPGPGSARFNSGDDRLENVASLSFCRPAKHDDVVSVWNPQISRRRWDHVAATAAGQIVDLAELQRAFPRHALLSGWISHCVKGRSGC